MAWSGAHSGYDSLTHIRIEFYTKKKKEIREYISALSGLHNGNRHIIFDQFATIRNYRLILQRGRCDLRCSPSEFSDEYKERIRKIIKLARDLRFLQGNPLVFSDNMNFWFDPFSKYVPEDQLHLAGQEIKFHTITTQISDKQFYEIVRFHQKRSQTGRWSAKDETADDGIVFLFESLTDYVEFRLLHECEME